MQTKRWVCKMDEIDGRKIGHRHRFHWVQGTVRSRWEMAALRRRPTGVVLKRLPNNCPGKLGSPGNQWPFIRFFVGLSADHQTAVYNQLANLEIVSFGLAAADRDSKPRILPWPNKQLKNAIVRNPFEESHAQEVSRGLNTSARAE